MRLALCVLLLLVSLSTRAASDYQAVAALVNTPETLQGRFEQTKYLAAVDTEINSSGRFAYQRDKLIDWHTLTPIESQLVLTPDDITSRQGDSILSRLETRNNPVATLLSDLFFGVMTANWERIAEYFDIQSRIHGEQWQAELTPLTPRIGTLVSRVELKGDQYLQQVQLFEVGGNRTLIRFLELQP